MTDHDLFPFPHGHDCAVWGGDVPNSATQANICKGGRVLVDDRMEYMCFMSHNCTMKHIHAVHWCGKNAGGCAVATKRVCGVDIRDSAVEDDHLIHAKVFKGRTNTCEENHFCLFRELASSSRRTLNMSKHKDCFSHQTEKRVKKTKQQPDVDQMKWSYTRFIKHASNKQRQFLLLMLLLNL